jgi:glycosyltransferase involved in cell wall biosynthesis
MTLLEAFRRSTDQADRLVVVGAGTIESEVEARVGRLALRDRVELTGLIPRDEVFVRCAGADVFVSTSRGEGLPVAAMEAMAARCPVILSDIPPHRELAEGADFIPLIPPGDVDGFAREIRRVAGLAAEDRLELGRRCRAHVAVRFALPIMHAGYDEVYREIARRDLERALVP